MSVTIDISDAVRGIADFKRKLRPAMVKALNVTAVQSQEAVRQSVRERFNLRRGQFVLSQVKVTTANESSLAATVHFDLSFMVWHQIGGTKTPLHAAHLAVPMAPELKNRIIPQQLRPRYLLGNAPLQFVLGKAALKTERLRLKAFATFGRAFIVTINQHQFVVTRIANKGPKQFKFWYYLAPSTFFKNPRLHMEQTVQRIAQANLQNNLRHAIEGIS